jgi:hypothetical protein
MRFRCSPLRTLELKRQVEHAIPGCRRLGRPRRAYVHLQRLVKQPRRGQGGVAAVLQRHELFLGDAVVQVLVEPSVVLDAHPRQRLTPARRVVVAGPDPDVARHVEEFACRSKQTVGVAAGEVTAGSPDVGVED